MNLSQQSLDAIRQKLSVEIEQNKAKLSYILARLLRKKKILQQANNHAKHKTEILLDKMEENSDLKNPVKNCLALNIGLSLSLLVQANIDILEDTILVSEPNRTIKAFVGSSSNS